MTEIKLEEIELISNEVKTEIEKGNTMPAVFNPLESAVKTLSVQLQKDIMIKPLEEISEEDFKNYKGYRAGINKVLKFVEDRRKDVTRVLDNQKKGYMTREKTIVEDLIVLSAELKTTIDEKTAYDKEQAVFALIPERKEKVAKAGIEMSEEELKLQPEEFNELYTSRIEDKIEADRLEKDKKDREEEIKKEAEENARKQARADLIQSFKNTFIAFTTLEEFDKFKELRSGEVTEVIQDEVWAFFDMARNSFEVKIKEVEDEQAKDEKYQEWLKQNDYNEETDRLIDENGEIKMYRLVSTYKK